MIRNQWLICVLAMLTLCVVRSAWGQASVSEDFTGTNTNNPWYFFNGACLTAGNQNGAEPNGGAWQMPGCAAIRGSYYHENLVGGQNGVAGGGQTLPDPNGQGALRFTNGSPGGFAQNGGIVSTTPFPTGQGVAITFKTVTYRGNSCCAGHDGADGISFFLMDASALDTTSITGTSNGDGNGLGSWGGSLGYTCSNANPPYNGLIGGYVGLGIDEYGNFLNGAAWMPGYLGPNPATGDNSALGYGYKPGRIGLRGAGNTAWNWLNANYPLYYPNTFSPGMQNAAVRNTCRNGVVYDQANNRVAMVAGAPIPLYDYAPIPNAYVELPAGVQIANEAAMARTAAQPIFYKLRISQDGLLSLHYSINGGAYQAVIQGQDITAANGPLPANFLFGFAGSTGGATNIHEILCFKADPATSAGSSAGASERQSAKLETGAQAYFAYYNPSGWTGRVTASGLGFDAFGNIIVAATPNWDAACALTGVGATATCPTTGAAGPIPGENWNQRTVLTFNGVQGVPFRWGNLTGAQQAALDAGDAMPLTANRLNYLRGQRANEINSSGVGLFRPRGDVLADIIDSSPVWVGPPIAPYTAVWSDRINAGAPTPETNAGAQTYTQFLATAATRLNVVYTGSNDGLLHGFRSGSYDS
ncbi:MAG: pilus assembly protein PilY, partial [Gammaproteobacteria bacterium]|nr:pilus assembly protein PilY [Gammaproteobacteria bacterium]